jgi:hypothetical protein
MGGVIIQKAGVFNIYGTIADGPYFESGITEEQLRFFILEEEGAQGLSRLPARLHNAFQKGTSSMIDRTLEDTICCNSENLGVDEFVEKYLTIPR